MLGINYVKRWIFIAVALLNRHLNTRLIYIIRFEAVVCTGCLLGIPFTYKDYFNRLCSTVFVVFLIFQIVINWICIRTVNSAYDVNKYGSPPNNCLDRTTNESKSSTCENSPTGLTLNPNRTSLPYFSWAPCLRCDRPRPPRCHHCPVCNKCILKRDHHCFFAGACVGYLNYRHFTVFLFWATIASIYMSVHALWFYYEHVLPNSCVFDLFIPFAIFRALIGCLEWKYVFFMCHGLFILAFILWIISSFKFVVRNINSGITKFETDCNIKIADTRPLAGKLEAVFGQYWMLNFILPLHFVYQPKDNPLIWPSIKVN